MASNDLISVAPASMAEDEVVIAKGYKSKISALSAFTPIIALWFTHDSAVIAAIGLATLCGIVGFSEARLYDLCIRLKRTNVLLSEQSKYTDQLSEISLRLFSMVDAFDAQAKSEHKSSEQQANFEKMIHDLTARAAKGEQ